MKATDLRDTLMKIIMHTLNLNVHQFTNDDSLFLFMDKISNKQIADGELLRSLRNC